MIRLLWVGRLRRRCGFTLLDEGDHTRCCEDLEVDEYEPDQDNGNPTPYGQSVLGETTRGRNGPKPTQEDGGAQYETEGAVSDQLGS